MRLTKHNKHNLEGENFMRGILYYPAANEEKILQQNMQDLEIRRRDFKSDTFHGKWDEIKKDYFADEKFIVHKNMHESCAKTIAKIKSGEYKKQDFMYNSYRLYELISDYTYITTTYMAFHKNSEEKLDSTTLRKFVEDVAKSGANLEEVKMQVLSSIFFNIDPMLDRVDEDHDILEAKMENAMRTVKAINWLEFMSPYEEVFISAKVFQDEMREKKSGIPEFAEYCRIFDEFDPEILGYIARCKMKSYFLLASIRVRFAENMDNAMKNSLVREIYEKRQPYENNMKKAYGVFKYSIREDFKAAMDAIMKEKNKNLQDDLSDEFHHFRLTTDREYEKYYAANQVEFTYKEGKSRRNEYQERQ